MVIPQGTRLGHYEIRSLIGAGGMGNVYLADDLNLKRPVALKLLRPDLAADEARLARFKREAYAASSLNHPNILTIYEIGREGDSHFMATEFIEGESLGERMKREPVQLMDILEIGIQVASALAAAHAADIIHRDIKPDNIMLRRDGLAKVVDFGIAKLGDQQDTGSQTAAMQVTAPGTVLGTAPYMSPEQIRGTPLDGRTDTWSLGVVVYQMVAGCLPFFGKTIPEMIAEILKTDPPGLTRYAPDTPAEFERIVTKALCKDQEGRYQVVKDLQLDLKTLKQRLEFEAELERSGARTAKRGAKTTQAPVKQTDSAVSNVRTSSSAEYLISEIRRHKRTFTLALLVFIAAIAGAGWWLYSSRSLQSRSAGTDIDITPLTSFPGDETLPTFSPDGKRIAFTWSGGQGDNKDIYIKQIGTEDLQRLTTDSASDIQPRWSPDGLYIAFLRQTPDDYGLYLVPSIGGTERLLTKLSLVPPIRFDVAQVNWAPDGEWLAVSDRPSAREPFSIFMIARDSGERRRLTSPSAEVSGDLSPAVSPDGKTVAYRHFESGGVSEIYLVPVAGGEPKRVTFSDAVKSSPAWTPDGRDILFLSESGGNIGLWRMPAAGGTPELVEAVGQAVTSFAISPQGDSLAWTQTINDSNIWQVELSGAAIPTVRKESSKMLISSTKGDVSSQFSPDGQRIVFASSRSGRLGIWVSGSDGQRAMQVVSFERGAAGSPHWSPDGKLIVFDARVEGNADIYMVSPEGGNQRRLTTESSEDIVPNFSRDGQWIYFCSNRSGTRQIWKMPASGGEASQVTKGGGFDNIESPDGQFVYYLKERGEPGIWRVPVAGGEESFVLDHHRAGLWRQWAVVEQGIFFITAETPDRPLIEFFSFATGKVSLVMTLEKRLPDTIAGLSSSPDGGRLIWTQLDQISSDITLMKNFR